MATSGIWAAGSIYSLVSVSIQSNVLATQVVYFGAAYLPVAWLLLALVYSGREALVTKPVVSALLVIPTVTQVIALTNGVHELLWGIRGTTRLGSFLVLELVRGPWFWVHAGYTYLLLAVGTLVFLGTIVSTHRLYRRQVTALILAILVPWAGNAANLLGLSPTNADPTPFLFPISGALFFLALFQFRLLDNVPIARDVVLEEMDDGVIVLDHEDRLVDVNAKAADLLEVDKETIIGRDAADVFYDEYVDRYSDVFDERERITIDFPDRERVIDLRISPLFGRTDELRGRVVILRDVTVMERQRAELERNNERLSRQNERLERFASIVSHDLQNPLQIARSRLDLVTTECESEHIGSIETAHERMDDLIDDLLALARRGQTVGEPKPIDLSTAAEAAHSLEGRDVSVRFDDDLFQVEADPGRLQQLFENLFQNAAQHAGPEVTVRIGTLGKHDGDGTGEVSGFYVEDDGPGVNPDRRDAVFDPGYTDSEAGTGLGLAIVQNIVEAHGWTISLTSGTEGGARFEITGVSTPVPDPPVQQPPDDY